MEQISIEFISSSSLVPLSVPKLWRFEKIRGSNTFATDGTSGERFLLPISESCRGATAAWGPANQQGLPDSTRAWSPARPSWAGVSPDGDLWLFANSSRSGLHGTKTGLWSLLSVVACQFEYERAKREQTCVSFFKNISCKVEQPLSRWRLYRYSKRKLYRIP